MDFINPDLNGFCYTEFFINFEGGFVRRGLLGEIIFQLSKNYNLSPVLLIQSICIFSYLGVAFYCFYKFSHKRYCWLILLGALFFGFTQSIIRKDYLLYGVFILMLETSRFWEKSNFFLFLSFILMCLGLLIHETFLFWGLPVFLLILMRNGENRTSKFLILFMILCLASIIFLKKGTPDQVIEIRESWNRLGVLGTNLQENSANSIGALGWDTLSTFRMHFKLNFYYDKVGWGLFPLRIIMWFAIYYFIVNYIFVFKKDIDQEEKKLNKGVIGILFILNTICLLPMFIFLSCDWARIYQYAVMATILPYISIKFEILKKLFPQKFLYQVERFNGKLEACLKPTVAVIFLGLLFIGVSPSGFSIPSAIGQSPVGSIIYFFVKPL